MEKKIGVEIEFTGVKRSEVVTALENLFHTVATSIKSKSTDDGYTYHKLVDQNGDSWLIVRDRSIKSEVYSHKLNPTMVEDRFETQSMSGCSDEFDYMVELVSPALSSKSLPMLFAVVDVIKSLGGFVNSSCGLHVHIDKPSELKDICILFKRFCLEQGNILNHFCVQAKRLDKYCKPYIFDESIDLDSLLFDSEEDFLSFLYKHFAGFNEDGTIDKRSIRYHALNFYSLVQHNTIEFRLFNSTLNKVEIAKILDWVLHFVYTAEDYSSYIPVLGNILTNEMQLDIA